MKTIKPMQVEYPTIEHLRPGMLVNEGVIISVDPDSDRYVTVSGPYFVDPGAQVPVYAIITPEMVEILTTVINELRATHHEVQ